MLEALFAAFGKAFAKTIAERVSEEIRAELEVEGIISKHSKEKEQLLQEVKDAQSQEERDAILNKLYDLLPTERVR